MPQDSQLMLVLNQGPPIYKRGVPILWGCCMCLNEKIKHFLKLQSCFISRERTLNKCGQVDPQNQSILMVKRRLLHLPVIRFCFWVCSHYCRLPLKITLVSQLPCIHKRTSQPLSLIKFHVGKILLKLANIFQFLLQLRKNNTLLFLNLEIIN